MENERPSYARHGTFHASRLHPCKKPAFHSNIYFYVLQLRDVHHFTTAIPYRERVLTVELCSSLIATLSAPSSSPLTSIASAFLDSLRGKRARAHEGFSTLLSMNRDELLTSQGGENRPTSTSNLQARA